LRYWFAVVAGFLLMTGIAAAQGPFPQSPSTDAFSGVPLPPAVGEITPPSGGAVNLGTVDTTAVTGGGVGVLMNNGNGTSNLVGPDGRQQMVATPP
jgi:hypothetical protein